MCVNKLFNIYHLASCKTADKKQPIEFYDFLQLNTDSSKSEVIDNARRDDEEVNQEAMEHKKKTKFIDFFSHGSSS